MKRKVVRAALAGLALGLMGGALALAYLGWGHAHAVCEFPDTEQCAFEVSTGAGLARLEFLAAVGCAAVATGLSLALRSGERVDGA